MGLIEPRFYMTYSRDRPNELVPWIEEHDVPLLTNAIHRWSDRTDSFMDMWEYDTPHVVDAGGYNVLAAGRTDYPWSIEEYDEWLAAHADEFEWATVMDYACEERFDDALSVTERRHKTMANTIDHLALDPDYPLLPVIQGREMWDYVESYLDAQMEDIPLADVGVGTVCRVESQKEIARRSRRIKDYMHEVERTHGFGVKVQSFTQNATFDSADSAAWAYPMANGTSYNLRDNGDGSWNLDYDPQDWRARSCVESFQSYYAYVTWLMGDMKVDPEPILERQQYSDERYEEYLEWLRQQ